MRRGRDADAAAADAGVHVQSRHIVLSFITSHVAGAPPSYGSPVHDAPCSTHNDHNPTTHTHTHTHISPLSTSYRQHVPSPLPVKHTHRQTDTANTHTTHIHISPLSTSNKQHYPSPLPVSIDYTHVHTQKIGEDRMCSSEDMIADRHTHRQTDTSDTHTYTSHHSPRPTDSTSHHRSQSVSTHTHTPKNW